MGTPAANATEELQNTISRLYQAGKITIPALLKKEEFNCRFWDKYSWKEWVKVAREQGLFRASVRNAGINSSWMEDVDGNRVGLNTQRAILHEVHTTWVDMHAAKIKLTNYRDMPGITMDYFRARLESKFPELRLCEDHWKADQAWQENFSSSRYRVKTKGKRSNTRRPAPGNGGDDGPPGTQMPASENAGDSGPSDENAGDNSPSDTQGPAPGNTGNDGPSEDAGGLPGDTCRTPETVRTFDNLTSPLLIDA